jgi:hypothetical protein
MTQQTYDQRNMHHVGDPEQLAAYHFAQAEHFERMKMASANDPLRFYQYAEQQFHNKAIAHRYKAMSAGAMMHQPMPGMMHRTHG